VTQVLGFVPARMASSRFPGKPLFPICGRPMVEHVFRRAHMFRRWDGLWLATCDQEIRAFGESKGFPVLMTAATHTRALDRVAEAAEICGRALTDDDIIVCVQGDEPMMRPDMIDAVVDPLLNSSEVHGTVLAMEIADEAIFRNPDTVKIVHDREGNVLYTSRSPVPYCKTLTPKLGARRIYGIFGFRWAFLRWFTELPESPLELAESCDSNRICDNGRRQRIAPYPYIPSFSVDSPADRDLVERAMTKDPLWQTY
jgi:3-deoxy-manno-octulosonate cytidylyltransferase (CMP-KDO synthetase)